MKKATFALGAAGIAGGLLLVAMPVAAQSVNGNHNKNITQTLNINKTHTTDNSVHVGNCSGIFTLVNNVSQTQSGANGNVNVSGGASNGAVGGTGNSQDASTGTSQSADQNLNQSGAGLTFTFTPTCNTNVTHVTKTVAAAQVVATPVGGVNAGLGGGAAGAPLAGIGGSISSVAYGLLRLRKKLL